MFTANQGLNILDMIAQKYIQQWTNRNYNIVILLICIIPFSACSMSKDIQKQDSLIMDTHIIKNDIINQILNDVRLRFEDSGEILLPQKRFIVLSIKKIKDTYDIKVSVIDYKYSNYFFDKNNYKGYFKQNGIVTFFWGDTDSFFSKKQNIKIEPLLNIKKPIGIIDIYEPFVFSYSIKNNLFTYLKSDHFALIHS